MKRALSALCLVAAGCLLPVCALVSMPPHARVNSRCYPIWNEKKTNLDVVWNDQVYKQPWTFNVQPGFGYNTTQVNAAVQRLWCTNSGAVGWYGNGDAQYDVPLHFTWLKNTSLVGQIVLSQKTKVDDKPLELSLTSSQAHGTMVVVGNILYYYSSYGSAFSGSHGFPFLAAILFDEYRSGGTPYTMSHELFSAFNVYGSFGSNFWKGTQSPIYPSGPGAITVSVGDYDSIARQTVDTVIQVAGPTPTRLFWVHSVIEVIPSTYSMTHEMLAVPGFACRSFANGSAPLCHRIPRTGGRFTWDSKDRKEFGDSYTPIGKLSSFSLPANLWLHQMKTGYGKLFTVLVTHGLGPIVAFNGSTFYGVEIGDSTNCSSHKNLVLATYDVSGSPRRIRTSAPLACKNDLEFPKYYDGEPAYQATAVKWIGPYLRDVQVFVAVDVAASEYASNTGDKGTCPAGQYKEQTCVECPAGYFCPGVLDKTNEKRTCPPSSFAESAGMAKCSVASGRYFAYPASVRECEDGYYCPGGLNDRQRCPAGKSHSGRGAWSLAQCHS